MCTQSYRAGVWGQSWGVGTCVHSCEHAGCARVCMHTCGHSKVLVQAGGSMLGGGVHTECATREHGCVQRQCAGGRVAAAVHVCVSTRVCADAWQRAQERAHACARRRAP